MEDHKGMLETFYKKTYTVGVMALIVTMAITGYYAALNGKLLVFAGVIGVASICVLYGFLLLGRSGHFLVDLRLLFVFSFLIYNCYAPAVFCFFPSQLLEVISGEGSKWVFEKGHIYRAQIASMLFVAGALFALLMTKKPEPNETMSSPAESYYDGKKLEFYMWLILTAVGFLWYVYPYYAMGFENALSYVRWERYIEFDMLKAELGFFGKLMTFLFNKYVVLIGFLAMFRSCARDERMGFERIIWIAAAAVAAFFLLFIDGRRREVMIIAIMISGYYMHLLYSRGMFEKIRKKLMQLFVVVAIMGVFFVQYQYVRLYVESSGYIEGVQSILSGEFAGRDKTEQTYYQNEFGLVYVTNMASIRWQPQLMYGATYGEALLYPLPILSKSLVQWFGYDENKTTLIQRWLGEIYFEWFDEGGGLGFSPSSEAFINFSYPGCFGAGLILGLLAGLADRRLFNRKWIVLYCIILGEAYGFSRASMTDFMYEALWMAIYFYTYSGALSLLRGMSKT